MVKEKPPVGSKLSWLTIPSMLKELRMPNDEMQVMLTVGDEKEHG